MATALSAVQQFDAPAERVFGLFSDSSFQQGRLVDGGGLDPELVSLDAGDGTLTVVTRQSIPASVLPSMVASMMSGNPVTERTETWRPDGDGYVADFSVVIKGAPASLKGTMALADTDAGSTLTVNGQAAVPIPMFGGKIEGIIVEQVSGLLAGEETYTRQALAAGS